MARHRKSDPSPPPAGIPASRRPASAAFDRGPSVPRHSGIARASGRHRIPHPPETAVGFTRAVPSPAPALTRSPQISSVSAPRTSPPNPPRGARPHPSPSHHARPHAARFDHDAYGPWRTPRSVDVGRNQRVAAPTAPWERAMSVLDHHDNEPVHSDFLDVLDEEKTSGTPLLSLIHI